jgi:hypothetical protein|tara:strand:- start:11793 stop:12551 length:759 start_codon:yes stop_codon:yes gene_type:complete
MIHYHGGPITGESAPYMSMTGKHSMISFARTEQMKVMAEICQSFAIDNGAFSVWKSGKEFDLDKFAEFISYWHLHPGFDFYLIPDVIEGSAADNQRMRADWSTLCDTRMWKLGAPVWHLHEPIKVLEEMVQAFPRVALGSSGEYAVVGNQKWWNRMSEAMEVACDSDGRPKSKLHGLRMLTPTVFSHVPLSSADSTNVARSISMDNKWSGRYVPASSRQKAEVLIHRIESHASANRWASENWGIQQNLELFG